MAIKVSKQNAPQATGASAAQAPEQTTDLAVRSPEMAGALAPFAATELFQVDKPKEQGNLLIQVKIPCPIEIGETFRAIDVNHVGLFDGTKFEPLAAGYIMTVIAAREATRKEFINDKGQKRYTRAYKAMGPGFDASQAVFEAHQIDPVAQKGFSYVVGIIKADGGVALAEFPTFRVNVDYWRKPLYQAKIQNGAGLKVKIDDHSVNVVTSKKGDTRYTDPNKFNQHEIVELTPQMVQALSAVWEANKAKFEAWTKQ